MKHYFYSPPGNSSCIATAYIHVGEQEGEYPGPVLFSRYNLTFLPLLAMYHNILPKPDNLFGRTGSLPVATLPPSMAVV